MGRRSATGAQGPARRVLLRVASGSGSEFAVDARQVDLDGLRAGSTTPSSTEPGGCGTGRRGRRRRARPGVERPWTAFVASNWRTPTSGISDLIGTVRGGPVDALTLLTTATRAVHHRCITATAFGGIWRNRLPRRNAWLSQNSCLADRFGEESGLPALVQERREKCGFPTSGRVLVQHGCIASATDGAVPPTRA